jgi:hypothetical protein
VVLCHDVIMFFSISHDHPLSADNEQLSNVDNLLVQIGACSLVLPDDFEARGHPEGKKLRELLLSHDSSAVSVQYCKKSLFKKTAGEATAMLTKVVGVDTHKTNSAEVRVVPCLAFMWCSCTHHPLLHALC